MREVTIDAAPSVTHASVPHNDSHVKIPSQPCRSPRAASSVNSCGSVNGTTNPNLIPVTLAATTDSDRRAAAGGPRPMARTASQAWRTSGWRTTSDLSELAT